MIGITVITYQQMIGSLVGHKRLSVNKYFAPIEVIEILKIAVIREDIGNKVIGKSFI